MQGLNSPRPLPFFVGRYRCEEYLGGGMADVYRAQDTELPRAVAIKILKPGHESDTETRQRFIDEAQLASRCSHDNVVTTYDKGEFEGAPFIVMEFLKGDDLAALIKTGLVGDRRRMLKIALQTARALEYVHEQKIIHRDLKPQNLNVDRSGRVKLVDFGIAKSVEWNKTQEGMLKGTAYYMAPEQIRGQPVTFATDVWAYGVLLFQMLTGKRPFEGETIEELWSAMLHNSPDWDVLAGVGTQQEVQRLVRKCLEKRPSQRYEGFTKICSELEAVLEGVPGATIALSPSRIAKARKLWDESDQKTRYGTVASGALLCLIVTLLILLAVRPNRELKTPTGVMVFVPGGNALLGPKSHTRRVYVPAFYIDKTEVSNKAYAQFLHETGYRRPNGFREDLQDYPVVNVTFDDAREFAKWAGKRLPTDVEWEKAARGSRGNLFPWGNRAEKKLANTAVNPSLPPHHGAMPVSSFPDGKSPYGGLNFVGNVWEWVDATAKVPDDKFLRLMQNDPTLVPPPTINDVFYQIRGGYFGTWEFSPEVVADSGAFAGRLSSQVIGFRCAKDGPN
jgi:serine/threonine-protein kinase